MCNCMQSVNESLKERNSKLSISFCLSSGLSKMDALPIIATEKLQSKVRGSATIVIPTFCPFCGTKYPRADDVEEVEAVA